MRDATDIAGLSGNTVPDGVNPQGMENTLRGVGVAPISSATIYRIK
jgi:hypothetical protein